MEYSLQMVSFGVVFMGFIVLVQSSCNSLCSPGEFLSSPCNCLPCPNGTFSDKSNNDSSCQKCKKRCEPSMVVRETCNKTHDTICSCKEGKYRDPGILFCVDCAVCGAGYGAIQPCSTDSNTVCSPCIPGKNYSNVTSLSEPCMPCTVCSLGYTVKRNCTNTTDTVCQPQSPANTTRKTKPRTTSKVPVSTRGSILPQTDKKRDILIPVLAVGVLLFLGLVVCLGIKMYLRRSKNRGRQPPGAGNDSEDAEEVLPIKSKEVPLTTSRHGGLRGRHTRHLRRNDNRHESSDSQGSSTGSLQEEKLRDPERLLRDLLNETLVIENLALLLNPKSRNNWVRLAGELGYSKSRVDYFNIDPTSATQNLLGDWRTMKSSTIGVLYGCLQKMKRDDACEILEGI